MLHDARNFIASGLVSWEPRTKRAIGTLDEWLVSCLCVSRYILVSTRKSIEETGDRGGTKGHKGTQRRADFETKLQLIISSNIWRAFLLDIPKECVTKARALRQYWQCHRCRHSKTSTTTNKSRNREDQK